VDVVRPAVQKDDRGPIAGPTSAYPTSSAPAVICLMGPNAMRLLA
jgi:hypothetical protein